MEYAFELDRIVKGKATQEEIDALDPAEREKMLAEAKRLKDEMQDMYEVAKIMAR
mgnify:FL=1